MGIIVDYNIITDCLCPECYQEEWGIYDPDQNHPNYVLCCMACDNPVNDWYLQVRHDCGDMELILGVLESPESAQRRTEMSQRKKEVQKELDDLTRERENPLWVVVELGERDRGWPVFRTKQEAILEYLERLDRETKEWERHKNYLLREYGESGKVESIEPGEIRRNTAIVLHEGTRIDGVEYEVIVGYGKFVLSSKK